MDLWTKTNKFSFVSNAVTLRRFNQLAHIHTSKQNQLLSSFFCSLLLLAALFIQTAPMYFKYEFNPYHCILSSWPLHWTVWCSMRNRYKLKCRILFLILKKKILSLFVVILTVIGDTIRKFFYQFYNEKNKNNNF